MPLHIRVANWCSSSVVGIAVNVAKASRQFTTTTPHRPAADPHLLPPSTITTTPHLIARWVCLFFPISVIALLWFSIVLFEFIKLNGKRLLK